MKKRCKQLKNDSRELKKQRLARLWQSGIFVCDPEPLQAARWNL